MKNRLIVTVLLLMLGVTGCMTARVPDVGETMVKSGYLPTQQPERNNAPVGKAQLSPYRQAETQRRYTLAMVDMDIMEALASLSRLSDVPIVAEPEVSGKVNTVVEHKTLAEILSAMLRPMGYSAYVDHGMIVVGKPRLVTRAFHLNYLKDKRTFSSVTNASISSTSGSDGTTTSSGTSSGGGQGNVRVTTTGSSDFWEELLKGLELIVFGHEKKGERSSGKRIVVNDMAGVVYVTDSEENIEIVSEFLDAVSKELKRQVLIQAHIVEIDLDKEFSLGIDWNDIFNNGKLAISQGLVPTPQSGVFSVNINSGDFNLMLDAFKEQGNVNMLSSPKISTMNNQKAVIKLTTKEVTWINSTTFNSTGDVLTTSTDPQIDEVGLFLDVTPNIDARGVVTMQVHPSISEIKSVSVSPDGNSSKPVINVREVDTVVEVNSGQTVVIAGLIVDRMREVKRSVPLLGDIPYLGLAFSNFHQEHKKTELVIFLTPFVLDGQSIEEIRQQHEQRLQGLGEINRFVEERLWQEHLQRKSAGEPLSKGDVAPRVELAPQPQKLESLSEQPAAPAVPAPEMAPQAQAVEAVSVKPVPLAQAPVATSMTPPPVAPAAPAVQKVTPPAEGGTPPVGQAALSLNNQQWVTPPPQRSVGN